MSNLISSANIDQNVTWRILKPQSNLRKNLFVIFRIACFATAVVGLIAYLGAIHQLDQIHGIYMMSAGGGSLIVFSMIAKIVNSYKKSPYENLIYGPKAWGQLLGLVVADKKIPPAPEINWESHDPYFKAPYKDNYVLVYIPEQVKVLLNYIEKPTIDTLTRYGRDLDIQSNLGNVSTPHGWILISKKNIPKANPQSEETINGESYEAYVERIRSTQENTGIRLEIPQAMDITIAGLMVGENLFEDGNRFCQESISTGIGGHRRGVVKSSGRGKIFLDSVTEPSTKTGMSVVMRFPSS